MTLELSNEADTNGTSMETQKEYDFLNDRDGIVCDSCAGGNGELGLGEEKIAQRYDIANAERIPADRMVGGSSILPPAR